jgi:hypothetical protein
MTTRAKKRVGPGAPCDVADCFNVAACEVVPMGRWRNMPVVKACRGCASKVVKAYETTGPGERGWAEITSMKKVTTK